LQEQTTDKRESWNAFLEVVNGNVACRCWRWKFLWKLIWVKNI